MAKPLQLSEKALTLIAGCIFDGLTDEETAFLSGVSVKFIQRARAGEECPAIKRATLQRKRIYIAKIRDGNDAGNHWQRIAWFLERRYPHEFAKPEVQLNLASTSNTTNQTLIITADVAKLLKSRSDPIDAEVEKLVLARSAASKAKASSREGVSNGTNNTTDSSYASTDKGEGRYSPARTPSAGEVVSMPKPSGNSENLASPPLPTRKTHKPQSSGKGKRARAQAMAGDRFAKVAKATKVKAGQAKRKPAKK